jgi:type IV pilus assembly protein PilP
MQMQSKQPFNALIVILLTACFLCWGCGDKKKDAKSSVVSKKISVAKQDTTDKPATTKATESNQEKAAVKPKLLESGTKAATRIYDAKERVDPFVPLFKAKNKEAVSEQVERKKRKKRVPQTPLERISLDQLKLVAIIRAASGNKALVEETSGKGYIIKKGTYIGLNSGIVSQINAASIVVEEEIENLMGEVVLQNTEIKLQKPAGE